MNTITLKLTKGKFKTLIRVWEDSDIIYTDYNIFNIVKNNEIIEVSDYKKFREFLNDEIKELNRGASLDVKKYDTLNSILSKLEVNK